MGTRTWIITCITATTLLAVGAYLIQTMLALGRPMYRPGNVREAAKQGQLRLDPTGKMEFGAPRADGATPFRLQVEPDVVLEGFARGQGAPVLVLHGGPGIPCDAPWPALLPLEGRRRFFYWHQRGSGRSSRPFGTFPSKNYLRNARTLEGRLGLGAQIADVERLRRALGAEQVDLVGHSYGGFLACLAAAEFPDRIRELLLLAPAPLMVFPPDSGGLFKEVEEALPEGDRPAYVAWLGEYFDFRHLFNRSEEDLVRLNAGFLPFYAKAAARRGMPFPQNGNEPALMGGWVVPALGFSTGKAHDWHEVFSRIRQPSTMVLGDSDLTSIASYGQYHLLPTLREEVLAGGGHFLTLDPHTLDRVAARLFP